MYVFAPVGWSSVCSVVLYNLMLLCVVVCLCCLIWCLARILATCCERVCVTCLFVCLCFVPVCLPVSCVVVLCFGY